MTNGPASAGTHEGHAVVVDMGGGIFKDTTKGLMWQKDRSQIFSKMEDAGKYVRNLKLGGYHDWRLPTIYELYDLNFTFDFENTRGFKIKRQGSYWSTSDENGGSVGAWETGDQCEVERNYFKHAKGYVRAVRP